MTGETPTAETIFYQAIELNDEARARFVREACRDSPEVRCEVERLLADYTLAQGFLEQPAAVVTPTIDLPPLGLPGTQIGTGMLLAASIVPLSLVNTAYLCSLADKNEPWPPAVVPVADDSPWLESLGGEQSSATAMTNSKVGLGYRRYCVWTHVLVDEPVFKFCQRWVPVR